MDIKIPKEAFPSITDWVIYNYIGDHSFPNAKFVPLAELNPTIVDGTMDGYPQKVITHLDYIPNYILMPNDGNNYAFGTGIDFGEKKVIINWNGSCPWSPFYSTVNSQSSHCIGHYAPLSINMTSNSRNVYNLFSRTYFRCYTYTDLTSNGFTYLYYGIESQITEQNSDYYVNCKNVKDFIQLQLSRLSPIVASGYQVKFFNLTYSMPIANITGITKENVMWIIRYGLLPVTNGRTLTIGSTILSQLTDEEKKIATDKGWILA